MPVCCQHLNCHYQTVKVVQIQGTRLGILKNCLMVLIFFYISFALVKDKLYQRKEPVISSVRTKVKGIAEVKERQENSILDPADYTFLGQGNSFFVMTNFLKTEGQAQGQCPEAPGLRLPALSPEDELLTGMRLTRSEVGCCRLAGPALLTSAENFTVLIKNNIDFPGHNYTTRNIFPGLNISCTFHKTQNPLCPIFRLGDIFRETGDNFSDVAIQGGIMGIEIFWDCNLDRWSHHCLPKYSFRRLDDKSSESKYAGFNFRYAKYYKENNVEKRTLLKVFGVRFDILVFGTGGKFDIIQLVVYIGSTLSYFGLVRGSVPSPLGKRFGYQAILFIDFLINTYSSQCCRSRVYPFCKFCKPCAVNEYYHKRKFESIVEPKPTLKYVSFVDEPYIRMVDQQLLGRRLQDVEGEKVPRPLMEFRDLSRLALSVHSPPTTPGQPEEIELLSDEVTSTATGSPDWCQCGHCLPSTLSERHRCLEELCCRRKQGRCITTSEPFRKLVLSRGALRFLLLYQEPLLAVGADSANRQLRHCAYQCYTAWRFGSGDLADFAILPSCCRWSIRKEFPKSNGKYSGFKSPY
ncbi:P2X purinoceptor 7 [Galemys pyrenaicus]|uniref:P2X purinoceptor n=1 Tax=Galemys pyrenaicus TaxID=202257 RepID=A0A8J6A704_GALPY|nr:P2X purinoceptor 7 [Galemys pyrenaicus]